jgi:hypothetical protein
VNKYDAEQLLRDATGGKSPGHGDTLVFDRDAGWLFVPAPEIAESLEDMIVPEEFEEFLEMEDPTTITLPQLAQFVASMLVRIQGREVDEQV